MPKAIRPRAHCLKNAPFMKISPLSNNESSGWLPGSISATALSKTSRRQMRFKSGDIKWHTRPGEWPSERVCLFAPCCNQCPKLQEALPCVVFTSRMEEKHRSRETCSSLPPGPCLRLTPSPSPPGDLLLI